MTGHTPSSSPPPLHSELQVNDKLDHVSVQETQERNEVCKHLAVSTSDASLDNRMTNASGQSQDVRCDVELEEPQVTTENVSQEDTEALGQREITEEDVRELQYLCRTVSMSVKEALQQADLAQRELNEICEEQEKVNSETARLCALLETVKKERKQALIQLLEVSEAGNVLRMSTLLARIREAWTSYAVSSPLQFP